MAFTGLRPGNSVKTPTEIKVRKKPSEIRDEFQHILGEISNNCILAEDDKSYGLKMIPQSGLSLGISPGRAIIDRKWHKTNELLYLNNLPARKAMIVYATKNQATNSIVPTLGHYDAVYPAAESSVTVLRYVFNEASGQIQDTSNNFNHGAASGTVTRQVDGWADYALKGDGSTGYITSANPITAPIGVAARELDIVFTPYNITSINTLVCYGTTTAWFELGINASGNLFFGSSSSSNTDTGFTIEIGKTYFAALRYDGSVLQVYVDGILVYSFSIALATASGVMNILRKVSAANYSNAIIHYLELRSAVRTSQQIAAISNKLCLPCHYTYSLQGNSISGGDTSRYPKESAFIASTGWESSQTGTGVSGAAYIGVTNLTQVVTQVKFRNIAGISSIRAQYQNPGGSWTDIQTFSNLDTSVNDIVQLLISPYIPSGSTHNFRLLANANPSSGSWGLSELSITPIITDRSIADDCLPSNSISLGFARTGSSQIIEYNDTDYKYMRNEGVTKTEGNKRRFLGWKYFSGADTLIWDNPFGTTRIKTSYTWAQDANGTNEVDTMEYFYGSSGADTFGIYRRNTISQRIRVMTASGGVAQLNDVWKTSGYIGCYAEML